MMMMMMMMIIIIIIILEYVMGNWCKYLEYTLEDEDKCLEQVFVIRVGIYVQLTGAVVRKEVRSSPVHSYLLCAIKSLRANVFEPILL
jgi:hypothetical protein